jgi:hypothetical protein
MSGSITKIAVRQQLVATGCEGFDIGVLRQDGRMLMRERWSAERIVAALNWLRWENAVGAHIYVRPCGAHAFSLVDDLSADSLKQMKESGFRPAVIVETSPDNFQAWLNHGRILDCSLSTQVAKELARRFGGDPSSADWRHFGRLAGFSKSPRDGCKTDWHRLYAYALTTDGFTPQHEIFWRKFACWSRRLPPDAIRGDPAGPAPPKVQFGRLRISLPIPGTAATFIGQKWHGL